LFGARIGIRHEASFLYSIKLQPIHGSERKTAPQNVYCGQRPLAKAYFVNAIPARTKENAVLEARITKQN
jgi:hypothetical protein